ncbi:MAG: hypothetical protein GY778_30255 [bacterium]|nr:hypothetical protein [bacterium]
MDQEFAFLAEVGFDTVFIRDAEDRDRARIAETAEPHGLRVAAPSRDVVYYVRTGRLPPGTESVEALAARRIAADRASAPIAVLGTAVDATSADRIARLAAAVPTSVGSVTMFAMAMGPGAAPESLRRDVSLIGRTPLEIEVSEPGSLLWLTSGQGTEVDPDRARLARYHDGLADGLTGGLVLDRFRVLPGRVGGVVGWANRPGARRSAALRRITARAARWGPKLQHLTPRSIVPAKPVTSDLRLVMFSGQKRRFVLVINRSAERFIHHPVTLPAVLEDHAVRRAVLVPADGQIIAGHVVRPRGNQLTLQLDLAPGDACLWELF